MRTLTALTAVGALAMFALPAPGTAGTKYQTSLVPSAAGAVPGFSASGSSVSLNGKRALKGKIKKVVDGAGMLVTTDVNDGLDDYSIEVDLSVPGTPASGTVSVKFNLKKGNGTFAASLSDQPVFAGAALGNGVAVQAVRVKDATGAVIGIGGFALE